MVNKPPAPPRGTGHIKCAICDRPIRDHEKLGPCENADLLPTDRMTVRKPHRGNTRAK